MSIATSATVSNNPTGSIWSKSFWKGAGERAVKTFAQAFLAVFGVGTTIQVTGSTLNADTWALAALSGAAAAVLSVVMSVANPQFVAGAHEVEIVHDIVPEPTEGFGVAVAGPDVKVEVSSTGGAHADTPSAESLEAEVAAIAARAAESRRGGVS